MKSILVLFLCAVAASATASGQSRTINVGDATINYEVAGEGTPLVLIHG